MYSDARKDACSNLDHRPLISLVSTPHHHANVGAYISILWFPSIDILLVRLCLWPWNHCTTWTNIMCGLYHGHRLWSTMRNTFFASEDMENWLLSYSTSNSIPAKREWVSTSAIHRIEGHQHNLPWCILFIIHTFGPVWCIHLYNWMC